MALRAPGQESYDEDKNTNVISFTYSGSDLNTITDTQGRVTSFAYDSNDRIKQITDPIGRVVKYLYQDGNNNLTDIVDANGKTTHFFYNGHDLKTITDPLSGVTSLNYQTGDLVQRSRMPSWTRPPALTMSRSTRLNARRTIPCLAPW